MSGHTGEGAYSKSHSLIPSYIPFTEPAKETGYSKPMKMSNGKQENSLRDGMRTFMNKDMITAASLNPAIFRNQT